MNGWQKAVTGGKGSKSKEVCLFNGDGAACRFGSTVAFFGLLGAIAFLVVEALFQNLSSIKIRRRVVMGDVGFSGVWAALFFFTFAYLSIAWGKSEYPPMGKGINSCRAAIVFSLFSIGTWGGCSWFAYQRWLEGADMTQFSSGFDQGEFGVGGPGGMDGGYGADGGANYAQYTAASDAEPNYNSNPFAAQQQQQQQEMGFQQPSY
ncbi:PREDICTED: synaptogyrin-3-like [Rhagoletis zephyria]|uniref:synaptogyrin-3-like n=1 Tax=Rhagoletis zephyria TaxID=28612 RepID=UPI0008113DD4|nr:PREDICTED: synaptogyrin-3-like [Rhagoletis zephyria]